MGQYYEDLLELYVQEPSLHTYQPALLHGDLSPDHFLADTEKVMLTGIIDFGDACLGDPAWDFIYIYEDYGPNVLKAFLDRYDPENTPLIERKVRLYQHTLNTHYTRTHNTSYTLQYAAGWLSRSLGSNPP